MGGRLAAARSSTTVAVVAAIVAVLAVAVPGVGIADPTTTQGGPPSDVFMTKTSKKCAAVDATGVTLMPTAVSFDVDSHLLVYFTSEWGGLDAREEGLLGFELVDGSGDVFRSTPFEWGVAGSRITRTNATVMWSFKDVPAGDYTVRMGARTEPDSDDSSLNDCALTVFVIPAAIPA
jgi:hypothetical protein